MIILASVTGCVLPFPTAASNGSFLMTPPSTKTLVTTGPLSRDLYAGSLSSTSPFLTVVARCGCGGFDCGSVLFERLCGGGTETFRGWSLGSGGGVCGGTPTKVQAQIFNSGNQGS